MLSTLLVIGAAVAVPALLYALRFPHHALYAGFFFSGVLKTVDLPVVGTKLALPDAFLGLALLAAMVSLAHRRLPMREPLNAVSLPMFFGSTFICLAAVSYFVNGIRWPGGAIESLVDLINYAYGFMIMTAVVLLVRDWREWQACLLAWLLGAVMVGGVALWALSGGAPDWAYDGYRITSTLRSVNQMQSFLAPIIVALLLIGVSDQFRPALRALSLLVGFALMVGMLGTGSRSAVILLGVALVIVGSDILLRGLRRPRILVVGVVTVGMITGFLGYWAVKVWEQGADAVPEGFQAVARPVRVFKTMLEASDAIEALGARGQQLAIVGENWHRRPILGIGPGNFADVFKHSHEVHNSYAGVLIEQGVPGLAAFLLLIASVLVATARAAGSTSNKRQRALLTIIVVAVAMLILYGAASFGVRQRIFWLTLGLALAGVRLTRRGADESVTDAKLLASPAA